MAGMAEASYLSHVTPGNRGNSMNDSSTPMAHRSAIVTSWRVSQRFVFVKSTSRPSSAARAATGESAGLPAGTPASTASAAAMAPSASVRMVSDMMSTFLSRGASVRVRSLPRRKETSPYEFLLYGLVIRRIGGACGPASHANSASSIRTVTVGSGISPDQPHALAAHEPLGAACATRPPETLTGRDDDKHQGRGLAGCRPCRVPAYRQ